MSTRSGKRIHNSFHENILKPDVEETVDSPRKTRSKRPKNIVQELSVKTSKTKKRANYVSYPSEDDLEGDTVDSKEEQSKSTRVLRKNALKERNLNASSSEKEISTDLKNVSNASRRTRQFVENVQEEMLENQNHLEQINVGASQKPKEKKGKKKNLTKKVNKDVVMAKTNTKKKKGKKGRESGSLIVMDIEPEMTEKNMSKINMSTDSFHSATGSPLKVLEHSPLDMVQSPQKDCEVLNSSIVKNDIDEIDNVPEIRRTRSAARRSSVNTTPKTPREGSRRRKLSIKNVDVSKTNETIDEEPELDEIPNNPINKVSIETTASDTSQAVDEGTSQAVEEDTSQALDEDIINSTYDLEKKKSLKNSTFDKIDTSDKMNSTYDKDDKILTRISTVVDTTFDKSSLSFDRNSCDKESEIVLIGPANKSQSRVSMIKTIFEKSSISKIDSDNESIVQENSVINTTFEKDDSVTRKSNKSRSSIKNSTFDKDLSSEILSETINDNENFKTSTVLVSSPKLSTDINNTFNKTEKSDSMFVIEKKLDATFDKSSKSSLISSDNSNITLDKSDVRISITSDDSQENIINSTPVLIESSLDESHINTSNCLKSPTVIPATPLKREGTFTKESPDIESPAKVTPKKRMSLPSPGCTPFPTKSVSQEKSVLNLTRSIEKSRRSSVADVPPRTTKVMFCSPVNNPTVVMQQRRKVIKSNLKGSNKSFVFEENGGTESRPAPRKRSYTQSEVDDARVKRKRLAEGLHASVDRLSRPRTSSASAKLGEPSTQSKKPVTPSKKDGKLSRTKLPNFAALHQKQFDKMESLGECQERKARRAKQLLTPTGGVAMLDRISPKETELEPQKSPSEDTKSKERTEKRAKKQATKPETPVKSLPTLKSLNPGYSRFGFKLNLDVNPFSIQSKNDSNIFSLNAKASKAKTSLFNLSSKKDNSKPLREIKPSSSRHTTVPSVAGTTSVRREVAKQTIMREKSFTDKRNVTRKENRTLIKGVRTNRRFELQMRMRNMD